LDVVVDGGVEMIDEIHRLLFEHTAHARSGGQRRTTQNWIGRPGSTPVNADWVPPAVKRIRPLLADLCKFIEREDLPVLAQAAIAYAQSPTCKRSGFRGLTGLPARGPQPADSLPRSPSSRSWTLPAHSSWQEASQTSQRRLSRASWGIRD
jgi:hypothetical protein